MEKMKRMILLTSLICVLAAAGFAQGFTFEDSTSYSDFTATVQVKTDTGVISGLVFRFVDSLNYYKVSLDATAGEMELVKAKGNRIDCFIKEGDEYNLRMDEEDGTIAAGKIGSIGDANQIRELYID